MGALKANDGGEYPAASDRTNIVMNSSLRDRFQETFFQLVQVAVELWFMYYPHLNSGAVMLFLKAVYEVHRYVRDAPYQQLVRRREEWRRRRDEGTDLTPSPPSSESEP